MATYFPELVNKFQGYQDRIKAIVLSGGAVHDATFVDALIAEMPSRYSIYTIDQFQIHGAGWFEINGSVLYLCVWHTLYGC